MAGFSERGVDVNLVLDLAGRATEGSLGKLMAEFLHLVPTFGIIVFGAGELIDIVEDEGGRFDGRIGSGFVPCF